MLDAKWHVQIVLFSNENLSAICSRRGLSIMGTFPRMTPIKLPASCSRASIVINPPNVDMGTHEESAC